MYSLFTLQQKTAWIQNYNETPTNSRTFQRFVNLPRNYELGVNLDFNIALMPNVKAWEWVYVSVAHL